MVNHHGWHLNGINGPLIHIRDDSSNQLTKQKSKKAGFTVDLLWWGSLRLAPIKKLNLLYLIKHFHIDYYVYGKQSTNLL